MDCLNTATADDMVCKSDKTCLTTGNCLDQPVCKVVLPIGRNAGYVEPTASACRCGFCEPSFGGYICFCPTRWALSRSAHAAAR